VYARKFSPVVRGAIKVFKTAINEPKYMEEVLILELRSTSTFFIDRVEGAVSLYLQSLVILFIGWDIVEKLILMDLRTSDI